ncbi:MAG: PilZ domain-containing protein [Betaproteobacteria bacterium]|nr:PilZ domain-containing protein [Betaproteobacteria bacterium]
MTDAANTNIAGAGTVATSPLSVPPQQVSPVAFERRTGPRPSVLSLNIGSKSALYAAYMPSLRNGGIFIPTARTYALGDEVFMLLSLMDDSAKLPIAGSVVWITPAGAQNSKAQGIGVQFKSDESGVDARRKIEVLLGGVMQSSRPTHTI